MESHNVDRVLRGAHVPKSVRWRIIRRTSRDNARTPVQWSGETNAGFTVGEPWLGINGNYQDINLAAQENDPDSIWSWYKELGALRRGSEVLRRGDFVPLEATNQVFAYRRQKGQKSLTVVLNFSDKSASTAQKGHVVKSNYGRTDFDGTLQPWEAVILG